jgi:hypothetical protein
MPAWCTPMMKDDVLMDPPQQVRSRRRGSPPQIDGLVAEGADVIMLGGRRYRPNPAAAPETVKLVEAAGDA